MAITHSLRLPIFANFLINQKRSALLERVIAETVGKHLMNPHQLRNVFSLPAAERYGYLIRKVADFEIIYLITDSNGDCVRLGADKLETIPVWPEEEFAQQFLTSEWRNYVIKEMSIYDFIDWLDTLDKAEIQISGFPNLQLNTVHVSVVDMKNHIIHELNQYE